MHTIGPSSTRFPVACGSDQRVSRSKGHRLRRHLRVILHGLLSCILVENCTPKTAMKAYQKQLTEAEIHAVLAYVLALRE